MIDCSNFNRSHQVSLSVIPLKRREFKSITFSSIPIIKTFLNVSKAEIIISQLQVVRTFFNPNLFSSGEIDLRFLIYTQCNSHKHFQIPSSHYFPRFALLSKQLHKLLQLYQTNWSEPANKKLSYPLFPIYYLYISHSAPALKHSSVSSSSSLLQKSHKNLTHFLHSKSLKSTQVTLSAFLSRQSHQNFICLNSNKATRFKFNLIHQFDDL